MLIGISSKDLIFPKKFLPSVKIGYAPIPDLSYKIAMSSGL